MIDRSNYQGDMIIPRRRMVGLKNAVSVESYKWPNGVIPYEISPNDFNETELTLINKAMTQFNKHTCIKFRPKLENDGDFVKIFKGKGCYSTVGRDEDHGNLLSLGQDCAFMGTIAHELMHTVGFYHEHSRHDRDEYEFCCSFWNRLFILILNAAGT